MARPARVRMRSRKPWVFARRRLFGWKVRLLTSGLQASGRVLWSRRLYTREACQAREGMRKSRRVTSRPSYVTGDTCFRSNQTSPYGPATHRRPPPSPPLPPHRPWGVRSEFQLISLVPNPRISSPTAHPSVFPSSERPSGRSPELDRACGGHQGPDRPQEQRRINGPYARDTRSRAGSWPNRDTAVGARGWGGAR